MGLSSSPRIFTKLLKPFFSPLRSQFGHTCLGYIDDSLYLRESHLECEEATLHAAQLFISLGFKIHPEKSVVIPTQVLEFLGFTLNSILMTVSLTDKKADKILQLCQKFSKPGRQFTVREVASFNGTLASSFPGVEFGPLRPVQTHYTRTIQHSTLYDRHCIALLGKVFKRTIHGLYNHSTSMTKQRIVG